eukprot:4128307-Pyramimonas_sp.AAC.1
MAVPPRTPPPPWILPSPGRCRRACATFDPSRRRTSRGALLGRQQFAIGPPAGAELLAHAARARPGATPHLVVAALGAENAFCTAPVRLPLGAGGGGSFPVPLRRAVLPTPLAVLV